MKRCLFTIILLIIGVSTVWAGVISKNVIYGSHPAVVSDAVASGFVGDNVLTGSSGSQTYGARCEHSSFEATSTGPISYIHVWTGNVGSAGNMNVGIYASTAGSPLRDSTLHSITDDGIYNFQLDSSLEITQGVSYRLGANSSQDWKYKYNSGGSIGHDDFAVGDTMGNITVNSNSSPFYNLLIWADNSAEGTTE